VVSAGRRRIVHEHVEVAQPPRRRRWWPTPPRVTQVGGQERPVVGKIIDLVRAETNVAPASAKRCAMPLPTPRAPGDQYDLAVVVELDRHGSVLPTVRRGGAHDELDGMVAVVTSE
jgi:hypothetical protein